MIRVFLLIFFLCIILGNSTYAATTYEEKSLSPFNVTLQRVKEISLSEDWKVTGWIDQELRSSLSQQLKVIQELTKNHEIKLPVTFDSVSPTIGQKSRLKNNLFVTEKGKISYADNSIIIANESIHISHANNCIVLARGAVSIGHGTQNIVVAGHYINLGHDRNKSPNYSIYISGSTIDISHAQGTIVCAPSAIKISHAKNVTFINPPENIDISHEKDSRQFIDKSRSLPTKSDIHDLTNTIEITQVVSHRNSKYSLVVLKHDDIETIMRINQTFKNSDNEATGWKLVFIDDDFALYEKDDQYASAYIPLPKR